MRFGQLIEYNKRNIFRKAERNNSRLLSEALYEVKASGLQFSFNIFRQPLTWHTIKTRCKTLGKWSKIRSILEKDLETVFPPHFVYDFLQKWFSCYTRLTGIIQLFGCLYFLRYWAISGLKLFDSQVVTSWIIKLTLSFQSSFSFYKSKFLYKTLQVINFKTKI